MSVAQGVPVVTVSTTTREITAHGGAVLLRETMRAVGLSESIHAHLHLKERARGLSEAEFVTSMAEAIALGATCLDDLAVARGDHAQTTLRGFAPPPPQTAGTWLRRFTLGHIGQLDKALREVVRTAFSLAGTDQVTLDFDSSYIFSRTKRRQGADRTYKKGYALHPLFCFEANTGVNVHARLRRGRAHTAKGMKAFLRETLSRMPEGVTVRARMDSGFYAGALFEQMEDAGVTYLCSVPLAGAIKAAIAVVPDQEWHACIDKEVGEVAEFAYRMGDADHVRRYVVKRILRKHGEQMTLEDGAYHYWVLVTNDTVSSAPTLESEHRHKALVEGGMRELKSNFGLHALRKHGFMANWAWLLLVCLGHNLCSWTQTLGSLEAGRDGGELRAKRLRYRYLVVPALLVRSGRKLILKLRTDYPFLERFLAALERLRLLPAPIG